MLCFDIGPISTSITFFLRYLHLSHWVFIFFTKSLPKIMNPVLSTYLHTVSTPECIAAFECQCTSLIKLYAKGECLYMIGTQNVSAAKSFITVDIPPVILILSVGRFFHCSKEYHLFWLISFGIKSDWYQIK